MTEQNMPAHLPDSDTRYIRGSGRCSRCMHILNEKGQCSNCHFDQSIQNPANALPVGTVVAERFWLGQVLHQNGEGITYIAYDGEKEQRVVLREFFPQNLSYRDQNGHILVEQEHFMQFKTVLTSFVDLFHNISKLQDECEALYQIHGVFKDNSTVYICREYFEGKSLSAVLSGTMGEIGGEDLLTILKPFFKTLSKMHREGMIHGGICPDNILVSTDGQVRLCGFATAGLRTADAELDCELFEGYSAPEQYSVTGWQGSWTDLYAMGATMYRCVTGTRPPLSVDRLQRDTLVPAAELSPSIDRRISNAIAAALVLNSKHRVHTVEQFASILAKPVPQPATKSEPVVDEEPTVAIPLEATNRFAPPQPDKQQKRGDNGAKKGGKRQVKTTRQLVMMVAAIAAGLVILGSVIAFFMLHDSTPDGGSSSAKSSSSSSSSRSSSGSSSSSSSSGSSKGEPLKVPDLEGMNLSDIEADSELQATYTFKVVESYSSEYEAGKVISVSPSVGASIEEGDIITLTVSKGKEKVPVPDLIGASQAAAEAKLKELGIQYTIIPRQAVSGEASGVVVETDLSAGTEVTPGEETLLVYVSQ